MENRIRTKSTAIFANNATETIANLCTHQAFKGKKSWAGKMPKLN